MLLAVTAFHSFIAKPFAFHLVDDAVLLKGTGWW